MSADERALARSFGWSDIDLHLLIEEAPTTVREMSDRFGQPPTIVRKAISDAGSPIFILPNQDSVPEDDQQFARLVDRAQYTS